MLLHCRTIFLMCRELVFGIWGTHAFWMQLFSASLILSHFLRSFAALTTLLHAHVWVVSDNHFLLRGSVPNPFSFALLDLFYCYHIDDEDGFCSFCALKEHMEQSIRRSGSVLMPARFKDNLSSILCIWVLCPFSLIFSQINGVSNSVYMVISLFWHPGMYMFLLTLY
jgi:hypothetical protein